MSIDTHDKFEALLRALVLTFKPAHDISSVASYVAQFPPGTARERVILAMATAIEEAAFNAREDSTHIDPVSRARVYLGQVEAEIKGMVRSEEPKPKRSRCREILAANQNRRPRT